MTPELWQRLKPLFNEALGRAAEDRAAFIDEVCGGDAELKESLAQLVRAGEEVTQTFDAPVDAPSVRPVQHSSTRFAPGEVVLGRFRIVRPIGRGGMGEVYEAEDLQLGRVALKTIRRDIASSPETFARFRHEVQLARRISGSQVCRIHELYLIPAAGRRAAIAFLTMEYLEGITLAERLKSDGPLPLTEALRVALDICEGLRLVHGMGVIHRDLKSANIMLCGNGPAVRAVLMDFGLAHDFAPDHAPALNPIAGVHEGATLPGTIMGTPAYMAPEQFEGQPVSPATDVYALGVVLYELVTGLRPYAAPTPVAAAIRRARYTSPPSTLNRRIPRKWDRVIQRCLQFEPADRFQSTTQVARELRGGIDDIRYLRQDRPWFFRLAAALILSSLAWGGYSVWQRQTYQKPGPEALKKYNDGLALIRQGNFAEATRLLQATLTSDPNFAMAHARLAEAWFNLDFQGSAQQELLIALPNRSLLLPLDRMYLDAIQQMVTGDSAAALETRRRILDRLPRSESSSGYVDLGMAYERVGNIAQALQSYAQAARQDPANPAAYMHTGILQSRLHRTVEGNQAFDQAQAIFEKQIDSYGRPGNPEGLAELDYERGYAANDRGDSKDAEPLLKRSLDEAEKIPSIQLEIRALSQLSSAASASAHDDLAVSSAQQAIKLATENQLNSWAAFGLVRLAAAKLFLESKYWPEAEQSLNEAFEILRHSPQPRVEALANSTLASLMDLEDHPDKVAEPAEKALDYYKKNGYAEGARSVALLLVRYQRDKGQYREALESGKALLDLAIESGRPAFLVQAEEAVGGIHLVLEQYPDALIHFRKAEQLGSTPFRAYMQFHVAETLWRLGRFSESEAMFKLASSDPRLDASVGASRVESLVAQLKYQSALPLAGDVIARNPGMLSDRKLVLEQYQALARAHVGAREQALAGLAASVVPAFQSGSQAKAAGARLIAADIDLALGNPSEALDAAFAAENYFASAGKLDSQLRSASLAAAAAKALHDNSKFAIESKNVLDIARQIQQNWGPEPSRIFFSRPDIHFLMQGAAKPTK
jgi:serine/threonine protein kinase